MSRIHIKELKEDHPGSTLGLDVKDGQVPSFFDLSYRSVSIHDIEAGSYILMKMGVIRQFVFKGLNCFSGNFTISVWKNKFLSILYLDASKA
uniref:Uncharacterized protein n=1 Tax=Kalanchoe fedtschenkoi TaxID=63787 RepID=A0A7N0TZB8_KALFE